MRRETTVNFTRAPRLTRPRLAILAAVLAIVGLFTAVSQIAPAQAASGHDTRASDHDARAAAAGQTKPTIVLVHGAFASASGWTGVIQRLEAQGYTVDAPPNPLQGVAYDSQTLADFLATINGSIVLVGHSYGGVVITNAAAGNKNVKALVYVDGYMPAQGETALALTAAQPGSCLAEAPATVFNFVSYPGAPSGDSDAYLKVAPDGTYPGFADCLANGVPASQVAILAATQRPIAFSAFTDPSGSPAWQTIPSWAVIGTADHVIPPAELLFMAHRAHAHITEINAGHLSLITNPGAVTRVIIAAANATAG
jgi:pimeloyl-ACP methyl ester carboxylesterase